MRSFVWLVLLVTACGPQPTTGSATLFFAMSSDAKASPKLVSPAFGKFVGDVYRFEDVSETGPLAGATAVAPVELADVDLRSKMATQVAAQTVQTVALAPGKYVSLGFLDVNASGVRDAGDPVTAGLTNQFEVVAGQSTKRTVLLERIWE